MTSRYRLALVVALVLTNGLLGCTEITERVNAKMSSEPDFYLSGGDGDQSVLNVTRACWKKYHITYEGRDVLIVAIEPAIKNNSAGAGDASALLGLAERSSIPFEVGLSSGGVGDAVVFQVLSVEPYKLKAIGIGALWKKRPEPSDVGS